MIDLAALNFERNGGWVTVVAQDAHSNAVLMVARADRRALELTVSTGEMHYFSRSRGLWHKGETSGNTQKVVSLTPDCDGDAVLARVIPKGPACHKGTTSCFGESAVAFDALSRLDATIASRASGQDRADGRASYTRELLQDKNRRLKKLGEETAELVVACAERDKKRAIEETADLMYHVLVALRAAGAGLDDVKGELDRRREKMGR